MRTKYKIEPFVLEDGRCWYGMYRYTYLFWLIPVQRVMLAESHELEVMGAALKHLQTEVPQ